ncbi:hypothetical protein [Undibacterium sp. Ren11W]|uniref:hypothetical protein n=1 Tax=Undibacterium sp. Ren11W TaxID=3413045 RepID=UPI003BF2F90B
MKLNIATCILTAASALLILGCKKNAPPPQQKDGELFSAQKSVAQPSAVPPRLPDPIVPKGAEAPSPLPGQAGDTSSEAFKNGGNKDPHK